MVYNTLPSYEVFRDWKAKEERLTQSSFVQRSGTKRSATLEITYFYCNQQGKYTPKGVGRRATKKRKLQTGGIMYSIHEMHKIRENWCHIC